jgi:Tol biopolymer transport system component
VKPANIILTKNGVKLLDFGLAKLRAPDPKHGNGGSALATVSVEQTEKGAILGTLQYMAPEQLEAKTVDERTDIFALGLVLYEMATGRRAYAGESQAALIAGIMRAEFTPVPNAAPAFTHILERCLGKEPAGRWHAAADVKLELEWAAATSTAAQITSPAISRRWLLAAVGTGTLLLGIAGTRVWVRSDLSESPAYRLSIAPPADAEFHRTPNHRGMALSPDGRSLVFLAMRNGQTRFWVQTLDSASARELPGTEEATEPFWSADGHSLGFFAGGSLKRIDIDGSNLQLLCDIRAPRGGSWNAQGDILFAPFNSANGTILRIPAAGGRPVSVTRVDPGQGDAYQAWPQFLPDGRRFLYWIGGREVGTYIGSLDDPKLKVRVLPVNVWAQFARDSATGQEFLFWHRGDSIVAQRWNAGSLQLLGEPMPLGGPVGVLSNTAALTVSSAGLLAYGGPSDLQMEWLDREGKLQGTVGEAGFLQAPRQSPDGRKVAVVRQDALLVTDVARGVTSRIATGLSGQNLSWSPDSTRIAFSRGGAVVVMNASGGGEIRLTPVGGNEPACWTPDGRFVLYVDRSARSGHALWTVPIGSPGQGQALLDSTFIHVEASISSDGRWLAYSDDDSGRPEVYVRRLEMRPQDQRTQVSAGGGDFPQWRSDGKELFYLGRDGTLTAVAVKQGPDALEFAAPHRLFPLRASYISSYAYDASGDGHRFLVLSSFRRQPREPLTIIVNWPTLIRRAPR